MIKDSGNRREFETGAVRDIDETKGRCDLMPLGVIGRILDMNDNKYKDSTLEHLYDFVLYGDARPLYYAVRDLITFAIDNSIYTTFLDLSVHFKEGAEKYGERNWEKGIPIHCYIDSAVRHYLKWKRGDDDEPHQRAALWNIVCAIWTLENMPELDDVPQRRSVVSLVLVAALPF